MSASETASAAKESPKPSSKEDPKLSTKEGTTRRSLLLGIGWATLGLGTLESLWSTIRFARAPVSYGAPLKWTLGTLERFAPGVAVFFEKARVFVTRERRGVRAMSAVCTHLGCTVRREGQGFLCPCHGSRYDEEGHVVSGPAPKSLAYYHLEQDKRGRLVVDLARPVSPEERLKVG
ncbi:MAG: Rieske (2Fe-2S) protein [Deltaproteobacteria bacterium]|nr:Rieske (2Fe-2S) protein [Deltaproteobacteria bacterium]